MTSVFTFPGGAANLFKQKLTTTSVTAITFGTSPGQYNVAWFRCNEIAGGTPNLTVELYDVANTTSYYLGSGGFTWKAKAMTALQSLLFDDGISIPNGWQLRFTAGTANQIDIVGVYVGKQRDSATWQGPSR